MQDFLSHSIISSERRINRLLLLLFVLVQVTLWLALGIETGLEAEKYVDQGRILFETGSLTEAKYFFYLPVILLVWLCHVLHIPIEWVALVQVVLSGIAQWYFYRLVTALSGRIAGMIASVLLLFFFPLQSWNFFLYSDSIFISLSMIYAWMIYRYAHRSAAGNLYVLGMLVLLTLSRPHGLLFIPPTLLYFLIAAPNNKVRVLVGLCSVFLLTAMYLFMNRIFTGGEDMDALKPFVEEHIICFVPQKPEGAALVLQQTSSPVNDLIYYVLHNPLHFLRLLFLRLYSFFNLTRPFYSFAHNLYLFLYMIPLYFFSIWGMIRIWRTHRPFIWYAALLLILYPLGATLQCDDWHSRFTMIVIPLFVYFAATAVADCWSRKKLTST